MQIRHLILYGKWIFIIALIFYSYAFIYKYAPSTKKRWKLVSPGAVIATSLSIIATIAFSAFVNNFGRYNILYDVTLGTPRMDKNGRVTNAVIINHGTGGSHTQFLGAGFGGVLFAKNGLLDAEMG